MNVSKDTLTNGVWCTVVKTTQPFVQENIETQFLCALCTQTSVLCAPWPDFAPTLLTVAAFASDSRGGFGCLCAFKVSRPCTNKVAMRIPPPTAVNLGGFSYPARATHSGPARNTQHTARQSQTKEAFCKHILSPSCHAQCPSCIQATQKHRLTADDPHAVSVRRSLQDSAPFRASTGTLADSQLSANEGHCWWGFFPGRVSSPRRVSSSSIMFVSVGLMYFGPSSRQRCAHDARHRFMLN